LFITSISPLAIAFLWRLYPFEKLSADAHKPYCQTKALENNQRFPPPIFPFIRDFKKEEMNKIE